MQPINQSTIKMGLVISLILTFLQFNIQAQSFNTDSLRFPVPVTRHAINSPLPDSIHVVGIIADYPVPGQCGVLCIGGTIKVKLTNKIPGYDNDYVFLVTACMSHRAQKNSQINVLASKLKIKEDACYYNSIANVFDSNGVPFYKLSEYETGKIK